MEILGDMQSLRNSPSRAPFPWSDWRRCFIHKEGVNTERSEQVPGGSPGRMELIDDLTGMPIWKPELRDSSHSYGKG